MVHRRFLILLILLGMMLVVHPIAMQGGRAHVLLRVLVTAVFTVAIWNVFRTPRTRWIALVLGVPMLVAHWAGDSIPGLSHAAVPFVFNLAAFLFLAYTVVMILRTVYLESSLSREAIYGALCGFLLIGAAFGHLFYCVDWLAPADFQQEAAAESAVPDERHKQALFMYFSFAALTGMTDPDLTPRAAAGRSLVLVESVLGQFYVIVVISELISLRVSRVAVPEPQSEKLIAPTGSLV
jgi:voltage-gated potassium channel